MNVSEVLRAILREMYVKYYAYLCILAQFVRIDQNLN
jgi:hypothetical protein